MKMNLYEESLQLHGQHKGKLKVESKVACSTRHDLSIAYTPGVAQPCLEIAKDKQVRAESITALPVAIMMFRKN